MSAEQRLKTIMHGYRVAIGDPNIQKEVLPLRIQGQATLSKVPRRESCKTSMRLVGLNDSEIVRLVETDYQVTSEAERPETDKKDGVNGNMAVPRKKLLRFIKAMIIISMLGTVFVFVRVHYFREDNVFSFAFFTSSYKIGDVVKVKLIDRTLTFTDSLSGIFLKVTFIEDFLKDSPETDSCERIFESTTAQATHDETLKLSKGGADPFKNSLCFKWGGTNLVVNDTESRGSRCYSVRWATVTKLSSPKNCLSLSGAHWYGGSLLDDQQWPLQEASIQMQPFVSSPHSVFQDKTLGSFGPVLERIWINSAGFGIVADSDEPLHVSVNADDNAQLCLKSQYKGSRYVNTNKLSPLTLTYTVCMDRNAKLVREHMVRNFVELPKSAPDETLMQEPVWSTRGINMNNLTQTQALTLEIDIKKHFPSHRHLIIAGNVTRTVGGVFFDHDRFPNAHQMVSEMTFDGFRVSTSVLPVVEQEGVPFTEGTKARAFLMSSPKQAQSIQWGNRKVALIDFTKPSACAWMKKQLTEFKAEAAVRAFHFASGEALLLSGSRQTETPLPNHCDYSKYYVKFACSLGNSSIVSVGYRSQKYALMVDIGARASTWGYELGLQSIIPSVLTLGLLGYPFVIVGPVGGVPVNDFHRHLNRFMHPDQELYIRWLQLSVFLPGLEISVGPWQYDKEVLDMAKDLFKNRTKIVVPILQTATKEFLRTGAPIIRPLWWMAGEDETAQRIDSEFLVSNKILVAPVLEPGARYRSIYLPKVRDLKWHDDLRQTLYDGGQWLHWYKVGLYEVATFRPVYKSETAYHPRH